jgi:hypothetical protein
MTASHATVAELTAMIENVGHTHFMGNLFSSPDLHDDLLTKTNCWGTVRANKKGMPSDSKKKLKMKWGDTKVTIQIMVFRGVILCRLGRQAQTFRETCCFHLHDRRVN